MLNYFDSVMQDETLPKNLDVLIDATNVKFDFGDNDLELIAEAHKYMFINFKSMKIALIVNTPTETALSILYKKLTEDLRLKFNVFCTKETANIWLKSLI